MNLLVDTSILQNYVATVEKVAKDNDKDSKSLWIL